VPVHKQPDDDLRVDAAFLGVADLARVVLLTWVKLRHAPPRPVGNVDPSQVERSITMTTIWENL